MHISVVQLTSSQDLLIVMVAGMCMMGGLKGQGLVIVLRSWLSDTTACLLFTPGTPVWLTAPSAPSTRIHLLVSREGRWSSSSIPITVWCGAKKLVSIVYLSCGGPFLCHWCHWMCSEWVLLCGYIKGKFVVVLLLSVSHDKLVSSKPLAAHLICLDLYLVANFLLKSIKLPMVKTFKKL